MFYWLRAAGFIMTTYRHAARSFEFVDDRNLSKARGKHMKKIYQDIAT